MNQFDNFVDKYTGVLKNTYVSNALYIGLFAYLGFITPKPSNYLLNIFDYNIVKLLCFFMLMYLKTSNASVSLIVSVIVLVSITIINALGNTHNEKLSVIRFQPNGTLEHCTCDCAVQKSMGNYQDCVCKCSANSSQTSNQSSNPNSNSDYMLPSVSNSMPIDENVFAELLAEAKNRISMYSDEDMSVERKREICEQVIQDYNKNIIIEKPHFGLAENSISGYEQDNTYGLL